MQTRNNCRLANVAVVLAGLLVLAASLPGSRQVRARASRIARSQTGGQVAIRLSADLGHRYPRSKSYSSASEGRTGSGRYVPHSGTGRSVKEATLSATVR